VAEQHVRHRVAGGVRASGGLEGHVARDSRSAVLIDAVANVGEPGFEDVLSVNPGGCVGNLNVSRGRKERKVRTLEVSVAVNRYVRNAVGIPGIVALIKRLELEAI